eukprot:m.85834 g.85834  ORF g.85834 m.85834 type:complete len:188 (-) comp13026_c0_seq5:823-1386(-)
MACFRALSLLRRTPSQHVYFSKRCFNDQKRIRILYDSECKLCEHEINILKKRDATSNRFQFVDICDDSYNSQDHANISYEEAMKSMHIIQSDGTALKGAAAFEVIYKYSGGPLFGTLSKLISMGGNYAEAIYSFWADKRLAITGRPGLEELMQLRQQRLHKLEQAKLNNSSEDGTGSCRIDGTRSCK